MNKAILMGRLTKDPDVRYTNANNTLVCSFTLAVDRRVKKDQEKQADFINIVAWDKLGEFVNKYFSKGQKIAITGRIQTRNWTDNNNIKHYITEIVAEEAFFCESKKETKGDAYEPESFIVPSDDDLPF